jgi:hypothetical protein
MASFGTAPVLLHQRAEHVPLAAVPHRVGEQEGNETAVARIVEGIEDVLEEPVGFLELVPVQRISLAELEGLQVEFLDCADAHRVEAGEHPAAARALLVGAVALLDLDVEHSGVARHLFGHARGGADAVAGHRVLGHDVGAIGGEGGRVALDGAEGEGPARRRRKPLRSA